MHFTLTFTLAAVACIAPVVATPSGCSSNYDGNFEITVVKPSSKRSLHKRDSTCGQDGYLTLKLQDGQLIDSKGRLGYIASNYQFQFDQPPQENAASVGGYSACENGSLALADSSVFYQCMSGNFFNLYDRSWAAQCQPILIDLLPCNTDTSSPSKPYPSTSTPADPVSQISDGQPQAPSATTRVPVSQISDGQPQAPTATTYSTTRVPVSQISDGQPQAPTATTFSTTRAPVSQISDGQPQAPSATTKVPVSQISDGQPQAPSASSEITASVSSTHKISSILPTGQPVTQISDGQPQAPPATKSPSSVASISHPTSTSAVVTTTSPPISAGGSFNKASSFGAFVIAAAAALML